MHPIAQAQLAQPPQPVAPRLWSKTKATLEPSVRQHLKSVRRLLTRKQPKTRQLLTEVLRGPVLFTPTHHSIPSKGTPQSGRNWRERCRVPLVYRYGDSILCVVSALLLVWRSPAQYGSRRSAISASWYTGP